MILSEKVPSGLETIEFLIDLVAPAGTRLAAPAGALFPLIVELITATLEPVKPLASIPPPP